MSKLSGILRRNRHPALAGGLLVAFSLFIALEVSFDSDGISFSEILFELFELAFALVFAIGILYLIGQKEAAMEQSLFRLNEGRIRDGGLQPIILNHFNTWGLTKAEEEIGLLILKGLSHRQIAESRGTSEATVRQQAQRIYEKSGVTGKVELLSFFLADLSQAHPERWT